MIDQLAEMRQQMLDEFHQARVMMFETIGSMREEHSAAFNKELEQLRHLAEEMETHRRELAQNAENLAANADQFDRYPRTFADELIPKSLPYRITEAEAEPEVSIIPASHPVSVNGNGNGHAVPHRPHDEQIHAVLCDRITRLKDDHQSRWQKILGIFPGVAAGKP